MNLANYFNQQQFDKYVAYLKSTNLSSSSLQRKLSSISTFQKFLIKKNIIPQIPKKPIIANVSDIIIPSKNKFLNFFKSFSLKQIPQTSKFYKYLLISSLIIIVSGIGITLYRQAITKAKKNLAYTTASTPVYANRFLSFQGRLTDSAGNPINSSTTIVFELYNTENIGTGTSLYTSATGNSQTVLPDENGIFSVTIGKTHGIEIPNSVFTQNSAVYLQITAGGEVMDPRQPIATVAYAVNSESLQGLQPSASGLKDTVLVIDGQGNLNLGETSPTIKSTSGTLGIEGQAILLTASNGSGGDIEINPDASGIIKLTTEGTGSTAVGGFIDATNANLSIGNLFNADINNTNRGYNFISFNNYDIGTTHSSTRFSIDASGNTYIGGTLSPTTISIGNTIVTSSASELNLLDGLLPTSGSIIYGNGSNLSNTSVGASGQVLVSNGSGAPTWVDSASIGSSYSIGNGLNLSSNTIKLGGALTENTNLTIGNTSALFINATSGNIGIGTTNPLAKLSILTSNSNNVYSIGESSASSSTFSVSGVGQSWQADDSLYSYVLPFSFPFFGVGTSSIQISTNGVLWMCPSCGTTSGYPKSTTLASQKVIAPLWGDWNTSGSGQANEDIYVDTSIPNQITFTWVGEVFGSSTDTLNFSATLYSTGKVTYKYGSLNTGLLIKDISNGMIAISSGDGANYKILSISNQSSQTNTNDITIDSTYLDSNESLATTFSIDSAAGNFLTVLNNGNIGIGNTNPTAKLTVNGNTSINGELNLNNYYITNGIQPGDSNFIGYQAGGNAGNAYRSNFFGYQAGVGGSNSFNSNFFGYQAGIGASNAYNSNFSGYRSGQNASGAYHSNFFGYQAGQNGSSARYSNFFGYQAGIGASYGAQSNFFGYRAGIGASSAVNSNFFGVQAGQNAVSAHDSNFFGYYSGIGASNAYNSNFFGYYSGIGASNAYNSNFFGTNTGYRATNASASNFFGQDAGYNANAASNSNFFGRASGYGATSASQSNFFGLFAGQNAANAQNSNFFGSYAGQNAFNANNSNFLGYNAGVGASYAYQSNFLGYQAGIGASTSSDSNFFGRNAGQNATKANLSNFFGNSAGQYGIGASSSNFFGFFTGTGASNAANSNFFGYYAGKDAAEANNSNFFGTYAGRSATNAHDSNFFGYQAGQYAKNAAQSNFFGFQAGIGASDVLNSNFFGTYAGKNAVNAFESNFFGYMAGLGASYAAQSNFFGNSAGIGASTAINSNFFGVNSGQNAADAKNSNFFGYQAGLGASYGAQSNFFGYKAGIGASSALNSNFFGVQSGQNAADASNSNFFGNSTGNNASSAYNSNFFGFYAGNNASSAYGSNFFGQYAGNNASSAHDSNFFGQYAGNNAVNSQYSNFFGYQSGYYANAASFSNFFGDHAGYNATSASNSNFFGFYAGHYAYNASVSNFLGYHAGNGATNAANSIFIGSYAGYNDTVNTGSTASAIAIGRYAGTGGFKNSIAIGHGVINTAEQQANIGNVLYLSGIYSSDTQSGAAVAGGKVGIGTTNPGYTLDVAGDGRFTSNLNIGGTLTLTQGATDGYVLTSDASGKAYWGVGSTASSVSYTASTGITLVSNDIRLNLGYTPTWTGLHTFTNGIGVTGTATFSNDINLSNNYITNGTQPGNSNFVGYKSGFSAIGATYSNFFGYYAGFNASNAFNSNFFGYYAGMGGISASYSNFFGKNAGIGASNAYHSNFFGLNAGENANNAYYSNFFGYYAGRYASSANYSNFFGNSAGVGASNAYNSNFFGQNAGIGASDARFSNFFGSYAGQIANKAEYSNFFGTNAGQYAFNAANSNFFGTNAGVGASNAWSSNFIGQSAGIGASNAYASNFIGPSVGQNATFAWGSNFFGYSVGIGASNANLSNFFGYETGIGASAAYSSNFFGQYAGKYAINGYRANYFGESAGQNAINASYSNFIGYSAGLGASSATGSNFIGTNAGQNATTARYSNFFGNNTGRYATNANFSNFIGINAGTGATNASNSIFIGTSAGYNDTVNTVSNGTAIAIGNYAGTGGFKNSIAIGHGVINTAEQQANIGNVLYLSGIYNSDTQSGAALASGKVGIGTTNPGYTLDIVGDGRFSTNLNIGGTLTISQGAQDGYVLTSDASGHTYWGVGSTASGVNYTASNGISQVGNDFRLNLGSTNVWLAPQIFTNGIGVTGTANLTNALNVGGTAYFANNVGIGTTSPIAKLHIFNSSDNSELLRFDATSGRYTSIQNYLPNGSYDNAGTQFYKNSTWGEFKFSNLNGDLLTINKVGNIGIGTTNPTSKLQVTGNIELGDGTTTQSLYAYNSDRSYYGQLELYNLATGNATLKTAFDSGNIILMPGTTGRVGIGTTNPTYKLDVAGEGRFSTNLNIGSTLSTTNLVIGSSNLITNLNADLLDGLHSSNFLQVGDSGTFIYTASNGISQIGNDFRLNLGSTNVWLAPQIFTNGIGVSGTAVFSNDINLSNNYITNGTQPGNSNFIGANAGQNAFNANNSNFFGQSAGVGTSYAHDSNFFGQSAGIGASSAYLSNFFGNLAGDRATNARNSNFLGQYAGQLGTNARNSNFLGQYAGYLATNADNSNFFGYNAGVSSVNANNSNFFGYQSGYGASNASYSNFFGRSAGTYGVGASYSNFFGYQSGSGASMAANSIFIGTYAGYNDTVNTGSTATAIAIGRYAGTGGFKNSIAIGRGVINTAEQQANIGNVLYLSGIYNSDTQSGAAVAGGKVGIGTTNPIKTLDVAGDIKLTGQLFVGTGFTGAAGQVLVSTGVGLSWTTVSGGPTYTASTGITLVGSDIQLNLGYAPVWTGLHTFTNGIGVSGTTNLTNALNVGGTASFNSLINLNNNYLTNGTQPGDSNFIGYQAGLGSSGSINSNFIGYRSGVGTSGTSNSNFFGYKTGENAKGTYGSNFFGYNAGIGVSNAYYSNFFGYSAGGGSYNAYNSNFFGPYAGSGANTPYSNFFGYQAGLSAANASASTFIGFQTGLSAVNASHSNFIGEESGKYASNAWRSNYFGYQTGIGASNASYSNFFGYSAGAGATNAANSIFIGTYAGLNDTVNTGTTATAIAIGRYAGTGGFRNSIALGRGVINTAEQQANFGNVLYLSGIYNSDTQSGAAVAGGKVGIGTTNPTQTLTVAGDEYLTGQLFVGTGFTGAAGQVLVSTGVGLSWATASGSSSATNGLQLISSSIGLGGTLTQNTSIGTSSFSLSFLGLGDTQSLYLNSVGNVGIGTTNTTSKLTLASVSNTEASTPGSELLSSSGWTLNTGWSGDFASGFTHTAGSTNTLTNSLTAFSTGVYQIGYTITNRTAGSFSISFGGQSKDYIMWTGNFGMIATSTSSLIVTPTSDFNGTIVFSIKRITNAYSPTFALYDSTNASSFEIRSSLGSLNNTFVGKNSGSINITGLGNAAFGIGTLQNNINGYYNVAQGNYSLNKNTDGYYNTSQGAYSLFANTSGSNNTAQGFQSLQSNTTGGQNTALGSGSLGMNTTGVQNNAVGYYSLYMNNGSNNNAFGNGAIQNNTTGNHNIGIGDGALYYNTTGTSNSVLGSSALGENRNGVRNIAFGYMAGRYLSNGSTGNTSPDYSVYLGAESKSGASDGNAQNEIVLGYNAVGYGSNSVAIGSTLISKTILQGNIGIGNTAPTGKLQVNIGNTQALFIASSGKVGIGTTNPGYTLDVAGDVNITGSYRINGTPIATGGSSQWTTIGSNIYYNAGAVGIGTTTPSGKLTVAGSSGDSRSVSIDNQEIKFRGDGVAHMSIFGPDTGKSYITFQNTSANSATGTAGTDLLTILSDGKVGIGTIAPSQRFQVTTSGANDVQYGIRLQNPNNSTSGASIGIAFANDTDAGLAKGGLVYTGRNGYGKGDFLFLQNTDNDLSVPTLSNAVMAITNGGSVGIGTTAPTQKLDVAGKVALNGIQVLYRPSNMYNSLIIGDGGNNLSHTSGDQGYYNTFIGLSSGISNTTGPYNTALGSNSLYNNTQGYDNTASGGWSLFSNVTGYENAAFGSYSLYHNIDGVENTALGVNSLFTNTTGSNNIGVGYLAGRYLADGSTGNSSPDYSMYLGYNTKSLYNNAQNEIVIGYNAIGNGSNSVVLGNDSITNTILKGNVGIGTTNPNYKLDVSGDINITGSYRINGTPISTGTTYTASTGITLVGSDIQLNLGYTPIWTGLHTFNGGIGVSGSASFGSDINLNNFYLTNGTQPGNSNFIGYQAGLGASNATNSNFFGQNAGIGASRAFNSNFFGQNAGIGASNAYGSNFFGRYAGQNAREGHDSNFFGSNAGDGSKWASYSNFFGASAGQYVSADYSNFFGYQAGIGATSAKYSNFMGIFSGQNAKSAIYSNFFGYQTGMSATNASSSNFFGLNAGAGATNAANSIFIGSYAGYNDTVNTGTTASAIAIGRYAGTGGFKDSIAIGRGVINTAEQQANIGNILYLSGIYNSDTQSGAALTTGKVGIGTTAPGYTLDVVGDVNITGYYRINGTPIATGGSSQWTTSGSNIYYNAGNVGIGTTNPSHKLEIIGNSYLSGNVGIGTTNPLYKLEVNGAVSFGGDIDLNNFFITNGTQPGGSNFIGYQAGLGATNAYSSNFFGYQAGLNANDANNSNFLGYQAGIGASWTSAANYFGQNAGQNAANAIGSNFFGQNAGSYADSAMYSNFFGSNAGENAAYANDSNFFGRSAGIGASNAYESNFFGINVGKNADYAYGSNFFGSYAGIGASGASYSNFFGQYAGEYAYNAFNSNFFGNSAGQNATNASSSNFFGQNAGAGSPNANGSNFIGYQAGLGASNASNSNFFGWNAGKNATYAANSNIFGYNAGSAATNAANAIFIGSYAGYYDTVDTTSSATAIAIGRYAGTGGFKNSIAIGRGVINTAEQQANIGNVLYLSGIYNSDTQSGAAVADGKVSIGNTAPTGKFQVDIGATQAFIITANGSVGLGTTNPVYKFQVLGNGVSGVAHFQNTNTGKTVPVITIQNGSSGTGFTGTYINFVNGAGVRMGRIRNTNTTTLTYGTTVNADFAEYVHGDEPTEPTDLIAYHGDKFGKAVDGQMIAGTHSNYATYVGNEAIADEQYALPLAMVGIVDVKISSIYGNISAGDPIATSPFAGIGAKANKSGRIVGYAIENYSNSNPNTIGTIKIIVQPTYYDSDINITSTGQIAVNYNVSESVLSSLGYSGAKNEIETATYNLTDSAGNIVNKIDQFSEIASAKIKAGLISAKNIIADNIVTKNLISQKVTTDNIISPLGNINHLTTQDIQSTNVETENLVAQNVQTTQVSTQNLETDNLTADNATISGTLYADNIISKEGSFGDLMTNKISSLREELQKLVAKNEATPSALLAESESWYSDIASDSATIHGDLNLSDNLIVGNQLIVNGNTQLGNTFINGIFNVGDIAIKDNLIETTNTALYIQPSQTGSVHIMGDTLVIADNGNVTINGNLSITGSFAAGNIIANEIQTNKLTAIESTINDLSSTKLNIATDSASTIIASESDIDIATSSAKVNSNATAGTATLPAGKTELIISTNKITPESMVYLTPLASTQNQVLYVKSKDTSSFTISLDNPLTNDIQINWWIIN